MIVLMILKLIVQVMVVFILLNMGKIEFVVLMIDIKC